MSAPASFELKLIKDDAYPPPSRPKQLKSQICKDPSVFERVDEHAINEAKLNYSSFRDLLWNLAFKKNFTDLQKARAIFRWMTCRDFNTISFSDDAQQGLAEQLLLAFTSGKTTYARIFECLARNAGLACVTITGWAKGVDYRPGIAITSRPVNHSWNAAYIDGNWQLIDSHWATRFLQSESNFADNLVFEYDDFYFIAEPSQLAYTHRPEDPAWQLLDYPQTSLQFEDYPLVKSYFFANDMHFLPDENHGVVVTKKGIVALSIGFNGKTTFTFKLAFGDSMLDSVNNLELNRFVVQETKGDKVEYHVRVPCRGDFYLIVFANMTTDNAAASENVFKAVCEYKIVAGADVPHRILPFPSCSDLSWGPDTFVTQFGLTPRTPDAVVKAPRGKASLAFSKKNPGVRVYARLVKDGVSDTELRRAVTVRNEDNEVTIDLKLPELGEYGLEMFANDPQNDGDMFTHVCQYLTVYTDINLDDLYGKPSLKYAASLEPGFKGFRVPEGLDGSATDGIDAADVVNEYEFEYPGDEVAEPSGVIMPSTTAEPEEEYKPHSAETYTTEIDVKPPENFEVAPIGNREVAAPDASTLATQKPFIDTSVFQHVDSHALEVSKLEHVSFREILWHLIFARNIENDLDRARAIFLWLCSKDLSKLNFPNAEKGSPEEILLNLQLGQTTYARVYETLCSYANLHCKTLTGLAKGADYKPGMKFATGQQSQHSWNAVLINGRWQLVDCHWAARRLVGQKTQQSADNVRYELDEYYFMPAPFQLVFTHFPDDPSWQLLERPISLEEFESLVPVKPTFFKCGLKLLSHTNAVIPAPHNADVSIRIQCPKKKAKSLRFTFNLVMEDGADSCSGVKLNRFAMQELVRNVCYVIIRPPQKGSYLLVVYAKDMTDKTKEGVYGGICEYKLVCEADRDEPRPYPPCVHTTWGPGDSASKFDMVPLQSGSILYTADGVAEVRFRLVTKLRFLAKLKSNEADEKALAQNVLVRVTDNLAVFRVHLLTVGEYGLEVYANNPDSGTTSLQHAYQYLIICRDVPATPLQLFPVMPTGSLGAQAAFDHCGLMTISNSDPYIVTETGDVQVSLGLTQPLRMTSQLSLISTSPAKDLSECILQQGGANDVITFILQLPEPGMFKFQLFAVPQKDVTESLPGVYTYLINCRRTTDACLPFPKQFGPWKDGCYLYEPLDGHLQANRPSKGSASDNQHVYFKMDIPRARNVAVVVGSEWTQLEQIQPGSWQGEVLMEKHWEKERKATVCANFGATATSYSTLLEFSM